MRASRQTRPLFLANRLVAVSLLVLLAACAPEKDLDLTAPVAGEADRPAEVSAPSYASAVSPAVSPATSTSRSNRSSRAVPVQPQRETVYYIEFRSRSAASYGHTFASIGMLDAAGNIETSEIVGLHPATESPLPWMIGHIVPVPSETGASDGDTEEKYWTARYRVRMDQKRYDELVAKIRSMQASSPVWHAVFYNCNAFVGDIARHMGLKAPANTMLFPKEYIEELATLNGA